MFAKKFFKSMFLGKEPNQPHTETAIWATIFGLNIMATIYGVIMFTPFALLNLACALWAFKRMRENWEVIESAKEDE